MKVAKQSDLVNIDFSQEDEVRGYLIKLDSDLLNVFTALQSRLRFGDGTDGSTGENISGQVQQFTTNATPGTEETVAHTLGSIPKGRIIMWQDKPGSLSQGPTTGTNWTSSNAYFTADSASVTFNIFLVK